MCHFICAESHISEKSSNICASYSDNSLFFSLNSKFSAVLAFTLIDFDRLGMCFLLLFKFLVAHLKEAFNSAKASNDDSLRKTLILTTGEIGRYW